jgi:hypothetical protein
LPFKCNLQRYIADDDEWHCADNPDASFASCADEEEVYTEVELCTLESSDP